MKRKFSIFVIFCGLFSTFAGQSQNLNSASMIGLGRSFDEEREIGLGPVVKTSGDGVEYVYLGQQASDMKMISDMSFEQLMTELNFKSSASLSLEIFKVNGGIDFLTNFAKNDLSHTVTFIFNSEGRSISLNRFDYTDRAREVLAKGNSEFIKSLFGHKFISRLDLGSRLMVSISIQFTNKKSKTQFEGEFGVDLLNFLKASASGGVKFDKRNGSFSIQIVASQVGGDPSRIAELFGNLSLIKCSIDDLSYCSKTLEDVINYGKEFGKQQQSSYDPKSPVGASVRGFGLSTYENVGLIEVVQEPSREHLAEIKRKRENLVKKYWDYAADVKAIQKLLLLKPNNDDKERLKKLQQNIENSIRSLVELIDVCYASPGQCLSEVDKLEKHVFRYDPEEVAFTMTFENYCEIAPQDEIIKKTIDRVRDEIPNGDQMDCAKLAKHVEKRVALNLSSQKCADKQISDLSPLSSLKSLNYLDLSHNQISDLEAIFGLALISLTVHHNALFQFPNITLWKDMEELDLGDNPSMVIVPNFENANLGKGDRLEFLNVKGADFKGKSLERFVGYFERMGKLKRFKNFFTSHWDICERRRQDDLQRGELERRRYELYKEKEINKILVDNGIAIDCPDDLPIPRE